MSMRNPAASRLPDLQAHGAATLSAFELGVTLGTGSFGRVRICTHKVSAAVVQDMPHALVLRVTPTYESTQTILTYSDLTIQETGTTWAIKMLKKSEIIRLQQVRRAQGCSTQYSCAHCLGIAGYLQLGSQFSLTSYHRSSTFFPRRVSSHRCSTHSWSAWSRLFKVAKIQTH